MIYTHVLAMVLAALMGATGAWKVQDWRHGKQIAEIASESRRMESARQRNITEALNAQQTRARKAELSAASARSELDGLRHDAANIRQGSTAADTERATAIAGLLAECGTAYTDLAGKAQRHVNDVRLLLEAWPKE